MTGFVHIVSVVTILAIAGAGFGHLLGAARVRDRLAAIAFVGVALLLFLPGIVAVLDGCGGSMRANAPTFGGGGVVALGLAVLGHAAFAIEIIRRRRRRDASSRDAERARARVRTRVPVSEPNEEEEEEEP